MSDPVKPSPATAVIADPNPVVTAVLADPVVQAVVAAVQSEAGLSMAASEPAAAAPTAATGAVTPGQVGTVGPSKPDVIVTSAGKVTAQPTTTEEEDRMTQGQRDTSNMWEGTQRVIAIGFAYGSILICTYVIVLGPDDLKLAALTYILTMGATVNQSYFTRTNHTKIGGVKYEGR